MPRKINETQRQIMDEAVTTLDSLRTDKKRLDENIKEVQESLLTVMEACDIKQWKVGDLKASRVQASSVVTDEGKLKSRLGVSLWTKVSTRRLDKKKLDAFIASGEIDPKDVAACSTEKTNAPFIRID